MNPPRRAATRHREDGAGHGRSPEPGELGRLESDGAGNPAGRKTRDVSCTHPCVTRVGSLVAMQTWNVFPDRVGGARGCRNADGAGNLEGTTGFLVGFMMCEFAKGNQFTYIEKGID